MGFIPDHAPEAIFFAIIGNAQFSVYFRNHIMFAQDLCYRACA